MCHTTQWFYCKCELKWYWFSSARESFPILCCKGKYVQYSVYVSQSWPNICKKRSLDKWWTKEWNMHPTLWPTSRDFEVKTSGIHVVFLQVLQKNTFDLCKKIWVSWEFQFPNSIAIVSIVWSVVSVESSWICNSVIICNCPKVSVVFTCGHCHQF